MGSDDLAGTIAGSAGLKNGNAYWLAYDVAFAMAEEWLSLGVSAVLDINPGWTFQWQQVDARPDDELVALQVRNQLVDQRKYRGSATVDELWPPILTTFASGKIATSG